MKEIILFVCLGNIHRSVLAETVLKQSLGSTSKYDVISRGIQGMYPHMPPKHANLSCYTEQWEASRPILEELTVPLDHFIHRDAVPLDKETVANAHMIIAMDANVYSILQNTFPEFRNTIVRFSDVVRSSEQANDCAESRNESEHRKTNMFIVEGIRNVLSKNLA
jgi:protein-tyrosine-phosphatase